MPERPGDELRPPLPPAFLEPSAVPAPPAPPDPAKDLERKVLELEKRLQVEREKVLLANLKSQEEATYAANVETAIKDVQEKLRRDRREADSEEARLKLEARIQELEARLIQERETWVTTLKEQIRTRESQDKEIEIHFASRLEEMERRWLEEKAHWQKLILSKDEEIHVLRAVGERLKAAELDLQKAVQEKRHLEERSQDYAALQAKVRGLEDKEKELFQAKAETAAAREQARVLQERLEHDLQSARMMAREREERLSAESDRLHLEVQGIAQRMRLETDMEIKKYKAEFAMSSAALQRLRAVAGALERQRSALRNQLDDMSKRKRESEQAAEKARAELLDIQRRWHENETRIRKETEEEVREGLKEVASKASEAQWLGRETNLRRELESASALASQQYEERIRKLREEFEALEAKLLAKTSEVLQVQEGLTEAQSRLRQAKEDNSSLTEEKNRLTEEKESAKQVSTQGREDSEKILESAQTEAEMLKTELKDLRDRSEDERKRREESKGQWEEERSKLEGTIADLQGRLKRLEEDLRQEKELACQELEGRIRILDAELDAYRKYKPGLVERLFGPPAPKPPKPPAVPPPPLEGLP